jgi:hypothetical protein
MFVVLSIVWWLCHWCGAAVASLSLQLRVAHMHCCSHYSVGSPYQEQLLAFCQSLACAESPYQQQLLPPSKQWGWQGAMSSLFCMASQ